MNTKKIKFAGPSKKMAQALENEGLSIDWPKTIHDREDLAIEATFYTGCDWEKGVLIDLRDMPALESKAGVDDAIANQFREAYDNFDIDEEMSLNLQGTEHKREARGVPDAERLFEDMKEQEKCLERFAEVAEAVAEGRKIPAKGDNAEVTIRGKDAKRVADLLERIAYFGEGPWNHEEHAFAKMIVDELRNKVKEG